MMKRKMVTAIAVLFAALAGGAGAAPEVGKTTLNLPGGSQDVVIYDLSPDRGSTAEGAATNYATPWGVSLAVSHSGRQLAASPAAGWVTENGPVFVDHVATVAKDGRLITFFWSPRDGAQSTETVAAGWKAVDLSEKTGRLVALDQPTAWRVSAAGLLSERIAVVDTSGRARVFSWSPKQDWSEEAISPASGPTFAGPLTSWTRRDGTAVHENVAGRTDKDALQHYSRSTAGWTDTDISAVTGRAIAGAPQGWLMSDKQTERVAAHDASQHLFLFEHSVGQAWSALDLTKAVGGQAALGPVAAWDENGAQRIAARSPTGDLLVFIEDPIEARWRVENVSTATKVKIAVGPVYWASPGGVRTETALAAPDAAGHVQTFRSVSGGPWSIEDVSATTGIATSHRLAAWTTPVPGGGTIEHLAAPTSADLLHVFSWQRGGDWTAVDVSTRSAGRVLYSATPWAGVFVSHDYGVSWGQSSRPQPAPGDSAVPGALPVPRILDVAVSAADPNLVFAAADREGRGANNARIPSAAGLYRSTDGGTSWTLAHTFTCGGFNRPVTQVEFAPDDPQRIYAAGHCGIARSTNGGKTFTLLSPPGTPGSAVGGTDVVYHLAVSSRQGRLGSNRTLVACGPGNIWYSQEDGAPGSWLDDPAVADLPPNFCGKTDFQYKNESAAEVLAINPENARQVYYAHHSWANGPSYYQDASLGPDAVACNIPVLRDVNADERTDAGDLWVWRDRQMPALGTALGTDPKIRVVDLDGNGIYTAGEPVFHDSNGDKILDDKEPRIAGTAQAIGTALIDDARLRYVAGGYGGYDVGFGPRQCGEGSLWLGDYSNVSPTVQEGDWTQLPGPPVYHVWFSNGSGSTLVRTVATPQGHLVLFADGGTLHVAEGPPTAGGWYRLDGLSVGQAQRFGLGKVDISVHADPRGLDVAEDLRLELTPADQHPPYHLESDLRDCGGGRVWLSGDGGVYSNVECGEVATDLRAKVWQGTETGLHILWPINVLGATGSRTTADIPRGIYIGTTHDDDFSTVSGGQLWGSPRGACGDCDSWFGDLYQRKRVIRIDPRGNGGKGTISVFESSLDAPPDPTQASQLTSVNYPDGARLLTLGSNVIRGARHAIQSLPSETPPARGDYVLIVEETGTRKLMRAYDSLASAATDSGFVQVGPDLPAGVRVVQAAGGHADPVFYLGDGTSIWRGDKDAAGAITWTQIVPHATAPSAARFFVDPWQPEVLYLIDGTTVRHSTEGGTSWSEDKPLTAAVTANGNWALSCSDIFCPLNDMAFDPTDPTRRFAAGVAGVFYTGGGSQWTRLLDTRALPSRPLSLWFDPLTDPGRATLVVGAMGRGVLALSPIPSKDPLLPVAWLAPPRRGPLGLAGWRDLGGARASDWSLGGAATLRRPGREEQSLPGREPVLTLGDGAAFASGSARIDVPCDREPVRIAFDWRAIHDRNREVPDAMEVWLEAEDGARALVATLGAEQSAGSWTGAEFELAPGRCGALALTVEGRWDGDRETRFELVGLRLQVSH